MLKHLHYHTQILLKKSGLALLYRFFSAGINYGLYLGIPLVMGVAELGMFALIQAWIVGLAMLATLGYNISILRLTSRYGTHKKVLRFYRNASGLVVFWSFILAGLLVFFAPQLSGWMADATSELPVYLVAVALPFQAILLLNVEAIRGRHNIKTSEFFRNLLVLLVTALLLAPAYYWMEIPHAPAVCFVVGIAVSALVSTGCALWGFRPDNPSEKTAVPNLTLASELKASLALMSNATLQTLNTRIMTILLGVFSNASLTGIFSFAFKLSTIPDFITSAVKAPGAPLISELFWSERKQELNALLQSSVKIIAVFGLPVTLFMAVFAETLLGLAGEEFVVGATVFRLLLAAQLFHGLAGMTGTFLSMTDNHKILVQIIGIALLVNVGINVLLLPSQGLMAAGLAFLIGTVIWNVWSAVFIWKKYHIRTYFFPFQKRTSALVW